MGSKGRFSAENGDFIRKMLKPGGRGVGGVKILYTSLVRSWKLRCPFINYNTENRAKSPDFG